ncbi:MAG: mevalonate kinase [Chloroflexi bacterium]|nr:mevalonate kinase [Chloroflexota bacterium]
MTTASAPAKIILFGEHAVVYGQPALAAPVFGLQATAEVKEGTDHYGVVIHATDINSHFSLALAARNALARTAQLVLEKLEIPEPDLDITVTAEIPLASGLGSGAAVSAALAKAMSTHLGQPLPPAELSDLVFEVEKMHHGTPSGIDNTVVCYGEPVLFVKGRTPQRFEVGAPLHFVVGDTGVKSPTRNTVGDVRRGWEGHRRQYESWFRAIGKLAREAHRSIRLGRTEEIGQLMNANQALLQSLDVSSVELETLINAAREAGALGAKLSGGGRGGNMVALVDSDREAAVCEALQRAGAARVFTTSIE